MAGDQSGFPIGESSTRALRFGRWNGSGMKAGWVEEDCRAPPSIGSCFKIRALEKLALAFFFDRICPYSIRVTW